ncbi:SRPBCC family protein [Ferrimonas gelatinilytica]|uniref:Polyketide cyclase / dehydrase and lipid transport n=1 Tax=Ferrimonas gelatinilytica TaxID=1255257 RepID=A0ABP9S8X3_9GAMM
MRYECQVRIARPRDVVVALFDNPYNLPKWQPQLLEIEPVQGVPGQPGAQCQLLYRMGKKHVPVLETVLDRALPDRFVARYQTRQVDNRCDHHFIDEGSSTLWQMECEFTFRGAMRLMALVPWLFRRQTQKSMEQFKGFAESDEWESDDGPTGKATSPSTQPSSPQYPDR